MITEEQEMKEATDEALGIKEPKAYPLYQYSVFLGGNRDEQLVIRANSFTELIEAKKNIDKIVVKREQQTSITQKETSALVCNFCGEPAEEKHGVSKKGKPWRGVFCSQTKAHVTWI